MDETVGYTVAQKAQIQRKAEYYAQLYDKRRESKHETKDEKEESEDELEARLKSIRGSLNHETFYDNMSKSTEEYEKKVQGGAPVYIHCDQACVCERCYQCICVNEKSKRNTGPKYEFDGSKCLSINCIPLADRAAFKIGLKKYYTRKASKPARGAWTAPKDNVPMSLRQTANLLVTGLEYDSNEKYMVNTASNTSLSPSNCFESNADQHPQIDSVSNNAPNSTPFSSSSNPGSRSVTTRQLLLSEPCIEDILGPEVSASRSKECFVNLNEINELIELGEMEGFNSMDNDELSMLYSQKAMYHIYMNELDIAYDLCELSLGLKRSHNFDAFYVRGCAAYCQREYDIALASFHDAIKIDPSSESAKGAYRVTLGRLSSRKDREYVGDI